MKNGKIETREETEPVERGIIKTLKEKVIYRNISFII